MGCYYLAANLDKKEKVTTALFDHSDKIGGWCLAKGPDSAACVLLLLLRERWAGDRIVLAGDEWAASSDLYEEAADGYTDVTEIGRQLAREEFSYP